jgi:hypothetical protein
MADSSSFTANVITEPVSSTGATVVSVVQSNVTESTSVTANIVTGVKGDQGDAGAPGATNHLALTNIGTNTHAQIDTVLATLTSGLATKQAELSLTTTGTSGAASLVGSTLNVPQYSSGGINATNLATTLSATDTIITSDTGTDATIPAADGTNAGVMTPTMKTKLDGIATGATANDTDANLKARASHTGAQAASTISDFTTAADARITTAIGVSVQGYNADTTTLGNTTTGTGSIVRTTSPTLVTPALGTPASGVATNLTGTASGLTAGNVTTNANLTGHVTSTGNATVLGSFTLAELSTAVSDANVARTDAAQIFTGIQTFTSPVINSPTGFLTGAAKITVGTAAPTTPTTGDLWVDTN